MAGTYTVSVTMTDSLGLSVTSSTTVTVDATGTSIVVSPSTASLEPGVNQQFGATEYDQFGNALASQPSFEWQVENDLGSITPDGLYTAPGASGVATVEASDTDSGASGTAFVTISQVAPSTPTDLEAFDGAGQVSLYWSASPEAVSYNVYRGETEGGPYTQMATDVTSTGFYPFGFSVSLKERADFGILATTYTYTDTDVAAGTQYYYVVTGVDSNGIESAYSNEATATPTQPLPAAPEDISAVAGDGQVLVGWSPVDSASGYNVYQSTISGGPYTLVGTDVSADCFLDTLLTDGTTYYYVVTALNAVGEGPDSSEIAATPQ